MNTDNKMSRVRCIIRNKPGQRVEEYALAYWYQYGEHISTATVYNAVREENNAKLAETIIKNYEQIKAIPRELLETMMRLSEQVGTDRVLRALELLEQIKK